MGDTSANRKKIIDSKKKAATFGIVALLLVGCVLAGTLIWMNAAGGGKKNAKQIDTILARLNKEPDCHKSLEQLKSLPIRNISNEDGDRTEAVERVLYYRIHCNNTLENYAGALVAAKELKAYYEKNNVSADKKNQANDAIHSIEVSQEAQRKEQDTNNAGQPVKNNGPIL